MWFMTLLLCVQSYFQRTWIRNDIGRPYTAGMEEMGRPLRIHQVCCRVFNMS